MSELSKRLVKEFADADYAHSYMDSHSISTLAAQVHWSRKSRGWSQKQLAERAGMAQERVSLIESGEFNSLTMATLRKLGALLQCHPRR